MKSMIVNEPPNYRQGGHKVTCAILPSLITWDMHIWIRLFRWVFPNVFHIFPHILRKISTYKQPVKYIPRQANLKFSTSLSKWCSQDSTVAPLFTALGLPIPSIPTRRVPLPPTPPPITPDSLGISKIARQITSLAALIWRCGPG